VVSTVTLSGSDQLVGYVTTSVPLNVEQAKLALAKDLPDIMVPTHIITLDSMPLTPNKKIDRKALPAPTRAPKRKSTTPMPTGSGTQASIAEIWSKLLGVSDIRGEDNFFGLGGHSLLAVQAHRDIKSALGSDSLSITDIFRFPTLDALAGHLDEGKGKAPAATGTPDAPVKTETISKRRAMRAGRSKAGA
jgi:hypothetical protein